MSKYRYHRIALEVGGSHYPNVGGLLLEKFGDHLLNSVIHKIQNCDYLSTPTKDLLINDIRLQFENHNDAQSI
jgi:hypothetical protein